MLKIFVTIAAFIIGCLSPALAADQTAMTKKQITEIRAQISGIKTTFLLSHQDQWCKAKKEDAAIAECFTAYESLIGKFSSLDGRLEKLSWERFVGERNALVPLIDEVELKFNPDKPKQAAAK